MSLSIDKPRLDNLADEIWKSAERLRGKFKAYEYVTSSPYGRDCFEATGKRTTNLASTNATKVRGFPIPLPPLAEQSRLVAHLDGADYPLQTGVAIDAGVRKTLAGAVGCP